MVSQRMQRETNLPRQPQRHSSGNEWNWMQAHSKNVQPSSQIENMPTVREVPNEKCVKSRNNL